MHICFLHCSALAQGNSPQLERQAVNGDLSVLIVNKSPFYSSFHKTFSSPSHGHDGLYALFNRPTAQCDECWVVPCGVSPSQLRASLSLTRTFLIGGDVWQPLTSGFNLMTLVDVFPAHLAYWGIKSRAVQWLHTARAADLTLKERVWPKFSW